MLWHSAGCVQLLRDLGIFILVQNKNLILKKTMVLGVLWCNSDNFK